MSNESDPGFAVEERPEILIKPNRGARLPDPSEIWGYRDLLFLLVRRDFVAKYRQTVLGPIWFLLQPLMMTLVFTVVFGRVVKVPSDGLPHTLFYLSGLLGWGYFSQVFSTVGTTFVANASVMTKVYFPRAVMPLAITASSLIAFVVQFILFLGFLTWFWFAMQPDPGFGLGWPTLLLPLAVLHTALIGLGLGLWMAALTAKYRDFSHLVPFLTQLLLYATPVIFPASAVPEAWRWVLFLNPMAANVESYRLLLLGSASVTVIDIAFSVTLGLALLLSGLFLFQRTSRTFADYV